LNLGDLIKRLSREDLSRRVPHGFTYPHSYRGYYDELAFVPAENVTIGSMLEAARSALGATFAGWKGGNYTMCEYTDVHLAKVGHCGEDLHYLVLENMLAPLGRLPQGVDPRGGCLRGHGRVPGPERGPGCAGGCADGEGVKMDEVQLGFTVSQVGCMVLLCRQIAAPQVTHPYGATPLQIAEMVIQQDQSLARQILEIIGPERSLPWQEQGAAPGAAEEAR
jgi:hypothetical protein